MKLKKLLKGLSDVTVKGLREIAISGISADSRMVFPGNLFIAKKGEVFDGHQFIPNALSNGASAVLTNLYDPTLKEVTQIIHPDPASVEATIAARYYEEPSKQLFTVGITGTNGKTSIAYMVRHIFQQRATSCGLIGTIEYLVGENRYTATRTTPDVVANHKMLREMCKAECRAAVMEATSHALSQGRLAEIDFDVALFSNLTQDHLDYHGTMEEYAAAKSLLFSGLKEGATAFVRLEDPWTERILGQTKAEVKTYGFSSAADLVASEIELHRQGSRAKVSYGKESAQLDWSAIGRYNISNALAAIGAALSYGISLEEAVAALNTFGGVRGRLERVPNALDLSVFVDFCHTDDALATVLKALHEMQGGRLITVFGCGGDRDKGKRPKMAKAAERYSDLCIVTSDNPRSEDPKQICDQVLQGFSDLERVLVREDRAVAIRQALELATPEDTVLIAGKGHETTQIFSHETIAFDDREVVKEICATLEKERCPQ